MKRLVSLLLVLVMAASLLAGCAGSEQSGKDSSTGNGGGGSGSNPEGSGKKPVLNVSVFAQEHEQAMYREVIKRFEEKFNCTVNFQVAGDQYWPELEAALTANAAPDVFYLGLGDIKDVSGQIKS